MSDTQNLHPSQKKEWNGSYVVKHNAKLIKASLESENSPLMPNADGFVKSQPIINANTGWCLNAKDLIPAQLTRFNAGYESSVVGTIQSMNKAENRVTEKEIGLYFNFKGQDGEFHHSAYFFPEQTVKPESLIDYAQAQLKPKAHLQQELSKETIKVEKAEDYLGAYVASAKSGAKIEVSPQVAEEFKKNMLAVCNNELTKTLAERNTSLPKLSDLMYEADKKGMDMILAIKKDRGIGQKKEKEVEKKFERTEEMTR